MAASRAARLAAFLAAFLEIAGTKAAICCPPAISMMHLAAALSERPSGALPSPVRRTLAAAIRSNSFYRWLCNVCAVFLAKLTNFFFFKKSDWYPGTKYLKEAVQPYFLG